MPALLLAALLVVPVFPDRDVQAGDAAMLLVPKELSAGSQASVSLTTLDDSTREPLSRNVRVRLLRGETPVLDVFDGATDLAGKARIVFDVPQLESGGYSIEARVTGIADPIVAATRISSAPAILIETDKPIYKPGQTIQGRVVLLDASMRPRAGDVELTVHDAKGIRVDRRHLAAGEFGAASFELPLASELNFGTWKLRAKSEHVESVRDVRVEEYVLPRFEIDVTPSSPWSLVNESIEIGIEARYFFGRDVEGGVEVIARRWVGEWQEYARDSGSLESGRLALTIPPAEFIAGSQSGLGEVILDVSVTDSTGHTQETTETITIASAPLVLEAIPLSSALRAGLAYEVFVTARAPDGAPLDQAVQAETTFFDVFGSVVGTRADSLSVTGGRATLGFVPPAETYYATLRLSGERDGLRASSETQLRGSWSDGSTLQVSLVREDGDGALSAGDTARFAVLSSAPGTVWYEVMAGGQILFAETSSSGSFDVTITPRMAPRARVVVYQLGPDASLAADSTDLEVNPSTSISITPSFGAEEVAPGEPVRLTLDAGTGERTLLGVSVVDRSVLALGESRLGLREVFAELEKRFSTPRTEVEAVEGGGGGGGAPIDGDVGFPGGFGFGRGAPPSIGALDVLESAGLVVATSPNLSVQAGGDFLRWLDFAEDAAGPPVAAGGGGGENAPSEVVRVRQYFPETWVWEPLLITDESGAAEIELTAPDSITTWKLQAIGTSSSGLGIGETELRVFQDFFVEPSLPYAMTRGEELSLKIDVFNYLDEPQDVSLSIIGATGFEILSGADSVVTVPASSASSARFAIRPTEIGEHTLEIRAVGSRGADAVRRPIRVVPEGVPQEIVFNHVIEAGEEITVDLAYPIDAVEGSERAWLHVTPNPVSQTMNGLADLLNMPTGCGEQNMIYLAPDIEILKYLRETGEINPEVQATAEYFVHVGYQRQLTYQTDDGGFAAFGGAEGSLWLTAFVLSTFSGAREVRDIDETVLSSAANMLLGRQLPDGSFQTDSFLIHQEMDGGLENLHATTAFVTNALLDAQEGDAFPVDVSAAISAAGGYLVSGLTQIRDDAYSLSISAVALGRIPGRETEAAAARARLLELAITDGVGMHWEPYPVETTGYATMALFAASQPEASAAIDWLTTQRNSLGGYGNSTQDTVVAIRALFLAARGASRDLDLDVSVLVDGETIAALSLDRSNFDLLHSIEIPRGAATATLRATGSGRSAFQVAKRFNVPGESLPLESDMRISVEYDADGVEVDDLVDVIVRLEYFGPKEATAMVLADIGIPTGFAAERPSLDALVEADLVSRVEVGGRSVILYLDQLRSREPVELRFTMRALFPVRAEGPTSRVYEYYDPRVFGYDHKGSVRVNDRVAPSFLRGDGNSDRRVDLSDSVATLEYLFLGAQPEDSVRCVDAADANDDGRLDITDPVHVLQYLFLGGRPPADPFPEPGSDPTEDRLDCAHPAT